MGEFDRFVEGALPRWQGYFLKRSGDPHLSEDLAGEAAMRLWRAYGNDGPDLWTRVMWPTAKNLWYDHLRARSRSAASLDAVVAAGAPEPPTLAVDESTRAFLMDVREVFDGLPLRQRQCLALQLEGYSRRESAEMLGISEEDVHYALQRARMALRAAG